MSNLISILFSDPLVFFIIIIMLVIALSVHEFSHALAADYLGDPTPRLAGRLTLNPLAHLDPIGSLLILFVGIGWGKPVPFDPFNLKSPKRDAAVISFAGPLSNLIMALLGSIILRMVLNFPLLTVGNTISFILIRFVLLNVVLAVFNLIPVSPLDGFKVIAGLLPKKYYHDWMDLERYGIFFLIFLIFPFFGNAPITVIMSPILNLILNILLPGKIGGII
jgi:Zn-dependent protease